jgi:hypothetical protein
MKGEKSSCHSHVQHLMVSYSPDAAPLMPSALVIKQNVPTDWGREDGRREAAFYRLMGQNAERFPMIIPHFELNDSFGDEGHFCEYCQEIEQNWQSCLAPIVSQDSTFSAIIVG